MVVPTATVIASSAALVPTNAHVLTGLANFRVVGDSETIVGLQAYGVGSVPRTYKPDFL
jgi:hypothetical protein